MTCNAVPGCTQEAFCYWQKDDGTQLGTCFDPAHQLAARKANGEIFPDDTPAPKSAGNDPPSPATGKPVAAEGAKPKASRNR